MKLTAQNVHDTFMGCLFKEGEPTENHVLAESVRLKIGFNPERLEENRAGISLMLDELSDDFRKSRGGGMSFLNMCNDRHGNQWADLHETMDKLVALGIAIGQMSFLAPREMWGMFHGGMPYLLIKDVEEEVQTKKVK